MQTHSNNHLIAKGPQLGSWDRLTTPLFEIIQDIGGPFQWVEGNGQNPFYLLQGKNRKYDWIRLFYSYSVATCSSFKLRNGI